MTNNVVSFEQKIIAKLQASVDALLKSHVEIKHELRLLRAGINDLGFGTAGDNVTIHSSINELQSQLVDIDVRLRVMETENK